MTLKSQRLPSLIHFKLMLNCSLILPGNGNIHYCGKFFSRFALPPLTKFNWRQNVCKKVALEIRHHSLEYLIWISDLVA